MKGIRKPEFLENINVQFICLVYSVIQHNLKACWTGQYEEPLDVKQVNSAHKSIVLLINKHYLTSAKKLFLSN